MKYGSFMLCSLEGALPRFSCPWIPSSFHCIKGRNGLYSIPSPPSQFTFVQEGNCIAVIFSVRLMLQSACRFLPTWQSLQNGQEQVPGVGSVSVMKITSGGRRRLDPEVIEDNWHMSKKNVERGTEHPQCVHIHWSFFFLPLMSSSF